MKKINVENTEITVICQNDDDYISLTDITNSQLQKLVCYNFQNNIDITQRDVLYNFHYFTSIAIDEIPDRDVVEEFL